jgi:flagellar biosynthesis/type III secretory pathway protein FliH
VVKDEALSRGSFIVETPFGIIDSSIETRADQVKKELEKILNR